MKHPHYDTTSHNYTREPENPLDAKQVPPLMLKLATLEKALWALRDNFEQLGERLNPITRPQQPKVAEEGIATLPGTPSSPIVGQIEIISSQVWALNARVRRQIEEMDL